MTIREVFSSLRKEERTAVKLLLTGTFLEYFDLMLYIHMAVVLNDLFFPKTDPHTAALLTAFAFCSTWVLRPLGALIFGYIGDNLGRKTTVILTTMLMALSCIVMASLPTYAQIGLAATWIMTACRIAQGLSSMGEVIGAGIYLAEITKPPARYPIVSLIAVSVACGSTAALAVATLATNYGFNWRYAFWAGAIIAIIGVAARTKLRETPDFVNLQQKIKLAMEEARRDGLGKAAELLWSTNHSWKEKVRPKTIFAYFTMNCADPIAFYFAYVYCSAILKDTFNFSAAEIIQQNLIVTMLGAIVCIVFAFLSVRIHPLKLQKYKMFCFIPAILTFLLVIDDITSPVILLLIQTLTSLLKNNPAMDVVVVHFPVWRRFTYVSFLYALSRALMFVITSFGMVYLTEYFGYVGLLIMVTPMVVGFFWGINHFEQLEKRMLQRMLVKDEAIQPQESSPIDLGVVRPAA